MADEHPDEHGVIYRKPAAVSKMDLWLTTISDPCQAGERSFLQ